MVQGKLQLCASIPKNWVKSYQGKLYIINKPLAHVNVPSPSVPLPICETLYKKEGF